MARPRTPIGTYGHIKVTEISSKTKDRPAVYEARARFRMANGRMRRLRASGSSKTAASNALKEKANALANEVTGKLIDGSTRLSHIMDLWLATLARKVDAGTRAPKTLYDYRDTVDNHLRNRLGELACREVSVTACDEAISGIHDTTGYASAKRAKVVLSGVCGYAVRHGAMATNPVKSVDTLERGSKPEIRVLEPEQRQDFLAKLRVFAEAKGDVKHLGPRAKAWTDLPDITEAMLSTGVRIGEVLAIVGDDIDPTNRLVTVDHHLVRVAKVGIVRMPLRKGNGVGLTLKVPLWSVPMWRRRKLESGGGMVFPAWNDHWVDPSNVTKRFRVACDGIGYHWVSSHIFRHTVGTHLGDADIAPTAIGDQLGNTADVVETHYRRKRVANEKVADSLESMMGNTGHA